MKGVFSHKPDSSYDDVKGERYHFPKTYLSRVEKVVSDYFVYYEQIPGHTGRFYSGVGRVTQIRPDGKLEDHYYADLADYLDFDRLVPYREDGGYESRLVRTDGSINGGTAQSAVRIIEDSEFAKLIRAGLSQEPEWPDRVDEIGEDTKRPSNAGFFDFDPNQPEIIGAPANRPVVEQLLNRKWRDRKFKQVIRIAYDRTCALTGLRLINGGGRPEVEAAHIRPVEHGGNDWVRNGIALSGTVHWMFDRGLLSLGDNFEILRSRKLNHDLSGLLRSEGSALVPKDENLQPHPEYLKWHRNHHGF